MKAKDPSSFILFGCLFNGCAIFFLPLLLLLGCASILDVSDIVDTGDVLGFIFLCLILPSFLGMITNTIVKVRKEYRYFQREKTPLRFAQKLDIIQKHSVMLTYRGWFFLGTSCFFIVLTMGIGWASLGTLTVFFLLTLYFMIGLSSVVGLFQSSKVNRLKQNKSQITRRFIPAVVLTGDEAKEIIECKDIFIPMGYNLFFEEENPVMDTVTRYALGTQQSKRSRLEGNFSITPRGVHPMGPMNIWYQDILGLTKVTLPAFAQATLKCLPRFRNILVVESPKSTSETISILTTPKKNPTEDYFLFKEYKDGDDTRRIHWGLSVKSGSIQVRIPEAKEDSTDSILLVLDNYIPIREKVLHPKYIENILSQLVELWLSIASHLQKDGKKVQIAGLADGVFKPLQYVCVDCSITDQILWQDFGARISWQNQYDIDGIMKDHVEGQHLIVVTSRFFKPPPLPSFVTKTWIYIDPLSSFPTVAPSFFKYLTRHQSKFRWTDYLRKIIQLPYEIGSEKNTLQRQVSFLKEEMRRHSSLKYFSKHIRDGTSNIRNSLQSDSSRVFNFEYRAGLLVLVEYEVGSL